MQLDGSNVSLANNTWTYVTNPIITKVPLCLSTDRYNAVTIGNYFQSYHIFEGSCHAVAENLRAD